MEPLAIAFIVMGSGVAGVIILHKLCGRGSKKNTTTNPTDTNSVTTPSAQPSHMADLERGEGNKTSSGDKDGGLVILEGNAALEITDAIVTVGGGGGGGGDGGDGCCFGGCGGSCGGCGGCGG